MLARRVKPDAILMDLNLPGMSGIEASAALRADPETRGIPIIALIAAALERDRVRAAHAGFARYLTKPVDVDALLAALEDVFSSAPPLDRPG